MAVTLTVPQLAYALRLQADTTTDVEEPINGVLAGLLSAATELVIAYAPTAPDAIHNEAVTRVSGYLYDVPPGANRRDMNPMRDSGAMPLLARYHVQRATSLAEDGAAPVPDIPAVGGLNADQVRQLIQQEIAGLVTSTALAQTLANHAVLPNVHHTPPVGEMGGVSPAALATAITEHADMANIHHTPPQAGQPGVNEDQARALIKGFAQAGNTAFPTPADLGPDQETGSYLRLRTSGGTREVFWGNISGSLEFTYGPDDPLLIPNPVIGYHHIQIPADGSAATWWYYNGNEWVNFLDVTDIVTPGSDGRLPPAANNEGRIGIGGNHFYRSVNQGGDDKAVGLKDWGPTRVVETGEPAKLPQELAYVGSVPSPPSGNYILDANAWDRGSQIWIINETVNDNDWADWDGPVGYHVGHIYISNADARKHLNSASDVGRVLIIGHGSGQEARIVTSFVAATEDDWEWIPIGIDLGDVSTLIAAHNAANEGRFNDLETADAAITTAYQAADADLQTAINALTTASGLTILPYSATATYTFGGANSFVTHGNRIYFYRSTVSRSSNHDPGQFPGYWLDLTEGVTYQIIVDGAQRVSARTICVFNDTDEVFLCTTTQTTPRDKAYIRAQAGSIGGAFIQLGYATIPRDKLPPVREWTLNEDYQKGEIVDTTGAGHVHFIALVDNNSSNISNRKQPGTPDGVGTWDQLFTVDNPPQAGQAAPPVQIVNGGAFDSSPENVTVAAWRTYRWLQFMVTTGTGNAIMRWVSTPLASVIMQADDDLDVPLQQNDALSLTKGAGDVLAISAKGFSVTTGNTIDVWGFA